MPVWLPPQGPLKWLLLQRATGQMPPVFCEVTHPQRGKEYLGRALVSSAVEKFFRISYQPRASYRAQAHMFVPSGMVDPKLVAQLVERGAKSGAARRALIRSDGDLERALEFLRTGGAGTREVIPASFGECPLLYLVLEIVECFFDMCDHCAFCGC